MLTAFSPVYFAQKSLAAALLGTTPRKIVELQVDNVMTKWGESLFSLAMTMHCPHCDSQNIIKSGLVKGRQRFKCKDCSYQFTNLSKERGKPLWMKLEAVLMYLSGMSMNATGKLLGVSAQSVLNWVRDFGEVNYEKPVPESAVVVELDELWHFVQAKKTNYGSGRHMTVILGDSSTGNWEIVIVKL
jgi:transposase